MFGNLIRRFSNQNGELDLPIHPQPMGWNQIQFLRKMINDELNELESSGSRAEQMDALADMVYYIYNAADKVGTNLDPFVLLAHKYNMMKRFPDGEFHTREDGKIIKPPGFNPPDDMAEKEIQRQDNFSRDIITQHIYLACPYTHKNPDVKNQRAKVSNSITAHLFDLNVITYSPISFWHHLAISHDLHGNFTNFREMDLYFISVSRGIIVICLEGWEESESVTEELKFADQLGLPIGYMNPLNYRTYTSPDYAEEIRWLRC